MNFSLPLSLFFRFEIDLDIATRLKKHGNKERFDTSDVFNYFGKN